MKRALKTILLTSLLLFTLSSIGCSSSQLQNLLGLSQQLSGSADAGVAYIWCTADKDAYVICRDGAACLEGDHNFGTLFWLNTGSHPNPNGEQRTYIHFYLPTLPAGTQILEAYLNVYEEGSLDPGTQNIPIALASDNWDPRTITWNNQPDGPSLALTGDDIGQFKQNEMWRGSGNLAAYVQEWFDNPTSNFGLILSNNAGPYGFQRSFRSDNALQRTEDDLDHAPRLLLKVQSDQPLNTTTIGMPPLPSDNDLNERLDGEILMLRISSGSNWPSDWEVAIDN